MRKITMTIVVCGIAVLSAGAGYYIGNETANQAATEEKSALLQAQAKEKGDLAVSAASAHSDYSKLLTEYNQLVDQYNALANRPIPRQTLHCSSSNVGYSTFTNCY